MAQVTRNLHDLAVAFRAGDQAAGWEFALSPQIQGCIGYWSSIYKRLSFVTADDVEDIKADLLGRVVEMLGNGARLRLPTYDNPSWNEGALVAWFKLAMQSMARKSARQIVGPRVGREKEYRKGRADVDIPFSQLPVDPTDPHANNEEGNGGHTQAEALLSYECSPIESMDATRKTRLLARMKHYFTSDEEARISYDGLLLWQQLGNWTMVAESLGLPRGKDRTLKQNALRLRNLIKSVLIEFGELVSYSVLGLYTSQVEAGLTLMNSGGNTQTWVVPWNAPSSLSALERRICGMLEKTDITFIVLNADDHSSPLRCRALEALQGCEPVVQSIDIGWLEKFVCDRVGRFRTNNDPRRRSLLLAHAKRAECQLRQEAV